jgi:hypothetical protein
VPVRVEEGGPFCLGATCCMTTSPAQNGAGLGTCGLTEPVLREMCERAGFREVRRPPLENPFTNVYEVRA